jgi:hypothetical protein
MLPALPDALFPLRWVNKSALTMLLNACSSVGHSSYGRTLGSLVVASFILNAVALFISG